MARIEGYVSKKNVRRWLVNYQALANGDQIDDGQVVIVNSGPKAYDGVSGGKLNKIMLDKALADMRRALPFSWRCCLYRWIKPIMRREALQLLGVSSEVYTRGCNEAVDYVYKHVNGELIPYKRLMEAINGKR
jgi:fimbrial chaperone protein